MTAFTATTERMQALALFALALNDDAENYRAQMQQISDPHLVAHFLVQMLVDCTAEGERPRLASELQAAVSDIAATVSESFLGG